ncbi:type II secretion system F family protein [Peterkaempfera griseoplana]|uniref:type II secretion system F family protein n=1 Tax=Peterkaempfera griseoplana TaxID=66896 RepID=UPI0007C634C0|nr:type II secretion system F family protein [Peterkaempfera griseoplana]
MSGSQGLLWAVLLGALAAGARGAMALRGRRVVGRQPGATGVGRGSRRKQDITAPRRPPRLPRWMVPELALLPVGLLLGWWLRSPVPVPAAALALRPLRRRRLAHAERRVESRREKAVVELCAAVADELRTGVLPSRALETAVAPEGAVAEALRGGGIDPTGLRAAARFAGDVPEVLRQLSRLPGADGAAAMAACWQVASESGAALATALDRVADALRADSVLREAVRGELAGPRTTALLLAVLPLFGLLLGTALGADPLQMLLHTPAGLACLAAGVALETAGLVWTDRIVRGAEGATRW